MRGEGWNEMSGEKGGGPSPALIALVTGLAAWTVMVIVLTASVPPAQRVLLAGSLLAVGGLICGMGYLSTLRRRALRQRQDSLRRMLERRRRERTR